MADITKTNHKGLGLPKHFDPSMEQMKKNMEVIDDILQKAVPNDLTSITDANAEPNINALTETGRYLVKSNATGYPVSGYAGVVDVFRAGAYILQEWRSINTSIYVYRRYSSNSGSSWNSWIKEWNANNDGSGSGLDADTIDGLNSTAFSRIYNRTISDFNNATSIGFWCINGSTNAPNNSGSMWGCIVFSTDISGSNVSSTWLCQIAIKDNTEGNTLYYRKKNGSSWSSWQTIWSTSSDGSGSGLDADKLDGKDSSAFVLVANLVEHLKQHKGYDYVVASQSDFDTMIASETWFDAKSVLFLCNVNGNEKDIVVPPNVLEIEGLNHGIGLCSSFGYASLPDDIKSARMYIRNLHFNNSNYGAMGHGTVNAKGIHHCVNLYNVTNRLSASDTVNSAQETIAFNSCRNLTNCFGYFGQSHGSSTDIKLVVYQNCSNLESCYGKTTFFEGANNGCAIFEDCTNLKNCNAILDHDSGTTVSSPLFVNCSYLFNCYIKSSYTNRYYAQGFLGCNDLINCGADFAPSGGMLYSMCSTLINCNTSIGSAEDCTKVFGSSQILHSIIGGTADNPTIINEQTDLPCIIKDGYSAFVNPETGTVLKKYYPHEPVMVLGFDTILVSTDGDLFSEYANPVGSFMVLSGDSTEIQYYKIDTQADTLEITGYFEKLLEKDGSGSKLDSDLLDGYEGSAYLRIVNLLTELKKVDGTNSLLDADLLDGKHASAFAQTNTTAYTDFNSVPLVVGMYGVNGTATNAPVSSTGTYSVIVTKTSTGYMMLAVNTIDSNIYRRHTTGAWSASTAWTNIGGTGLQQATATVVNSSGTADTTAYYLKIERSDKSNTLKSGDVLSVTMANTTSYTGNICYIRYVDSTTAVSKYLYNANGSSQVPIGQLPKYFLMRYDGTNFELLTPLNQTVTVTTSDPTSANTGKYGDIWYTY